MDIPKVEVVISKRGNVKAKLLLNYDDSQEMKLGEYALVKIESLNDRIAVEEFIENLKNK